MTLSLAIYMLQLLVTLYTSELSPLPYDYNHDTGNVGHFSQEQRYQ